MLFNSYSFVLLFLPAALISFYCIGHFGRRAGGVLLAVTSFVFYGFWNPSYVPLLLGSIAFNYAIGTRLKANEAAPKRQSAWLAFGIGADLAVLIYYKYLTALIGMAIGLGATQLHLPEILLPLGISFFTFTQIGYLIDMQQGVVKENNLLNYAVFVTFFPHLIAGPILHNREIMPQFSKAATYRASYENLSIGIVIFTIGLAKKCLFADPLSDQVSTGFAGAEHLTLAGSWMLMITYAAQLYFDFSGYTDMAIGIARMFNITFPANFNSPYKAANIIDFWQRWHMTLTRFLTLYLFNPIALTIARRRTAKNLPTDRAAQSKPAVFLSMVACPVMITMGIAGIWHGAGLQFLIFGVLHGLYLVSNHAYRIMRGGAASKPGKIEFTANWCLTMGAILVALVFFRAPNMEAASTIVAAMAGLHGVSAGLAHMQAFSPESLFNMIFSKHGVAASNSGLKSLEQIVQNGKVCALWIIILFLPNTQQILSQYQPVLGRVTGAATGLISWRPNIRWALLTGATAALALMAIAGTSDFVYFQF